MTRRNFQAHDKKEQGGIKMKMPKSGWRSYECQNPTPRTEQEFVLRLLDMIQEDAVRFRLSNLVIWYIREAIRQKRMYYLLNIVAIVANLIILIVNAAHNYISFSPNLVTTVLAAVASGALSVNGLGHYKDNWMRYRTAAETLKEQISQYVIKLQTCQKWNRGKGTDCPQPCGAHIYEDYGCPLTRDLMQQVNKYVTEEVSAWKQSNEKDVKETEKGDVAQENADAGSPR